MIKPFLLCFLLACSAPPPATISVNSDLPDNVIVAIYVARDAWCAVSDRTHWCPELVSGYGEATVRIKSFKGKNKESRAHNTRLGAIEVQTNAVDFWLDGAMTHEFGHFGINKHVKQSALMKWYFETDRDVPVVVDDAAIHAWCEEQGC